MIRNSFGRALAATGALVAFVTLGATAAMAQTTNPVNDAFASSQTKMSGYVTTGIGVIITLVAWILTQGTSSTLDFASYNAMGNFGMTLTIAGIGLFLVMSLRRYFRYWLVRFIYEMRDQADRVVSK